MYEALCMVAVSALVKSSIVFTRMTDEGCPEGPSRHVEAAPCRNKQSVSHLTAAFLRSLQDVPDALWVLGRQVRQATQDLHGQGLAVILEV